MASAIALPCFLHAAVVTDSSKKDLSIPGLTCGAGSEFSNLLASPSSQNLTRTLSRSFLYSAGRQHHGEQGHDLPPPVYNTGQWSSGAHLAKECPDVDQICDPDNALGRERIRVQLALDNFYRSVRVECRGRQVPFRLGVVVAHGLQHDSWTTDIKQVGDDLIQQWQLHAVPGECPTGAVILLLTHRPMRPSEQERLQMVPRKVAQNTWQGRRTNSLWMT